MLQVSSLGQGVSIDQSRESSAGMLDSLRVSAEDTRKSKVAASPNKEEKPVEIPYIQSIKRLSIAMRLNNNC